MNPYEFLRNTIYGWKTLFEKFKEGCLVHEHLLNLSRMKEAIMSLFFAWRIQSSFSS